MAMFSKRHYEVVAAAFRDTRNCILSPEAKCGVASAQYHLLCAFKIDNPRFDAERFNKACEPKEGE